MISVLTIFVESGVIIESGDIQTIEVDKFTPEECKKVSTAFGDVVFYDDNVIQLQYYGSTVLFVNRGEMT